MRRTKLDLEAIRSAAVAGLPRRARWVLRGTPLDFDFSRARRGLRHVTSREVHNEMPEEWSDLLVFGGYDYAQGGGASPLLAVRQRDGAICGLDVELEDEEAVFLFNSSMARFVETFAALDPYLRAGRQPPADVVARVRGVDRRAYRTSEWRLLIENLTAA